MKSTGIRRKVDDLGRVVIPAGIRRSLGIREGDEVDVSVDGDLVILSKPVDRCVFCGSDEDLQDYRTKMMCRACVASVGVLDENLRRTRAPGPEHVEHGPPGDTPRSEPLPPWTDTTRSRPPLPSARPDDPSVRSIETAPTRQAAPPEPSAAPAASPAPAPPPAAAEREDDRERSDEGPREPPASTAW